MKLLVFLVVAFVAGWCKAGGGVEPEPAPSTVTMVDNLLTIEDHSVCECCYPPCCCRCAEEEEYKPICTDQLDICWLVDGSGTITQSEFVLVKNYIIDVSSGYQLGGNGVLMGMTQFSTNSTQHWLLSDAQTSSNVDFADAVSNMVQTKGFTNTVEGMETVIDECFGPGSDRVDVPNMAIILTDGRVSSRKPELVPMSAALNAVTNGNTLVLGVTSSVAYDELVTMAGGNAANVFEADAFDEMKDYVSSAILQLCQEASTTVSGVKKQCICCCPSPYGFGEGCACQDDVI